ncbi:hypothetical protein Ahy_A10g048170 isoform C [Arachis hypogaea]|uniref:Glycosyltransferases n=1 Tax=Arachis hypogaea TaxID=3818 RepID=A0A445B4F0_ARAHY|nr:hypothetical protein Ahy_A10g048170 isoform A [Arachis hypogaea]RYR33565.1 hypothetical protein Ahy_A10g048170 isoform B [Arachis hypogaea]RYR33566.1 hypothetical protein Ahy_A10g048170 isoform C [Arachis hypogaea]
MASIRRTLSPVPRAGGVANLEVCSVGSPLSKSSSSPHSSAFVLGVFSPRSLRALERSKPKGQLWRKVLLHFFICFMIGVSIGFIPLASRNLSTSLMPKHQAFSFENTKIDLTSSINETTEFNATLNSTVKEQEQIDKVRNDVSNDKLLNEEPYLESQKLLIIVTQTVTNPFQAYYLHRLAQTLKLVSPPLLWIVVEMTSQSEETAEILRSSGIMYRHLVCKSNVTDTSLQGILQRNVALSHIETHRLDGIVYFADVDNIYSVEIFQQIREISQILLICKCNVPPVECRDSNYESESVGDSAYPVDKYQYILHPSLKKKLLVFGLVYELMFRKGVFPIFVYDTEDYLYFDRGDLKFHNDMKPLIDPLMVRFGTWTVAKLSGDKGSIVLQGPVCDGARVIGWHVNESNRRSKRFHIEMPGFAFNSTILWDPKRWHRPTLEPIRQLDSVKESFRVSTLIEQVVEDESQMEGLMNNCSSVMVWHIDLEPSHSFYPQKWMIKNYLDVILPLV